MSPNFALLFCAVGLAGILYELQNPRFILPGAAGLALVLSGGYIAWSQSVAPYAFPMLLVAALLLGAEAIWNTRFLAGALAVAALAAALCLILKRYSTPAVTGSVLFGSAIIFLLHQAKHARRNKQIDL